MGYLGVLWGLMGSFWGNLVPMGLYGVLWVLWGLYWALWGLIGSYGVFMGSFASYGVLWGPYGVVTSLSRSPHRMQPLIPNGRTHPSHNDPTGRSAETDGGSA